jgi:hypothetical protein
MTIEQLNKWIKQHGYKTVVYKTSINIYIPYANDDNDEIVNVSTIKEARNALGY